ncbi:RNA polymerase sigma factor [Ktedonospora formicarum]|uniref:RNA polymerase sigma factor n=1 Tax=Ktedonospora formicarum TaxID=2778364 RepID=A0A8J3HXW0_9CHLR|nr:RNA polymerase sigma factor [Ktedonospora formicarum]GHO43981.1 RNA polymerase sigma factor [Ktedonospora formicarum]
MYQVFGGSPPENSEDKVSLDQLVAQARRGDATAFATLFEIFSLPICTYLTRLVGNDELGRDLAQDTFLKAWKGLSGLQEELQFRAWLYRIATNIAYAHLRHERHMRWLPWMLISEHESLSIDGPEEWISEVDMIQHALRQLSPQYRACLLLQVIEGFSQREIAHMLHISEKSVGSNVSRARERFRKFYQPTKGAME